MAPHWPRGVHGLVTAQLFSGRLPHKQEWLASGLDGVAAELRGLVQEQDAVVPEGSRMYLEVRAGLLRASGSSTSSVYRRRRYYRPIMPFPKAVLDTRSSSRDLPASSNNLVPSAAAR